MTAAEKKQLVVLLGELQGAVDELLLAGLTAASKSTIERIDVTFKEAARMRLLRLASNLRIANEEISRFTAGAAQFSARRLAFFLGRVWLLALGMQRAIEQGDDDAVARLMATPATMPVDRIRAVTLGVGKRVVPGTVASFEFRMRALEDASPLKAGQSFIWSFVFPMRKDLDLPAEAFLHLPQKQKFKPSLLLEKNIVEIAKCFISCQPNAVARLTLGDQSDVKTKAPFKEWQSFWKWERNKCAARLAQFQPTPLDLEIELQEEVFLQDWDSGAKQSFDEGYDELALAGAGMAFSCRLDRGASGNPLLGVMTQLAHKKNRPPIFGVAHYEACKIILQPLAALGKDGPEYLTVSPDKISQAELVKAMKFT